MKKLNVRFALFALFAMISVAAPLSIAWKYENTLRNGRQFMFRTKPVDPYDAFRGRYVTLAFEDGFVERIRQVVDVGEPGLGAGLLTGSRTASSVSRPLPEWLRGAAARSVGSNDRMTSLRKSDAPTLRPSKAGPGIDPSPGYRAAPAGGANLA